MIKWWIDTHIRKWVLSSKDIAKQKEKRNFSLDNLYSNVEKIKCHNDILGHTQVNITFIFFLDCLISASHAISLGFLSTPLPIILGRPLYKNSVTESVLWLAVAASSWSICSVLKRRLWTWSFSLGGISLSHTGNEWLYYSCICDCNFWIPISKYDTYWYPQKNLMQFKKYRVINAVIWNHVILFNKKLNILFKILDDEITNLCNILF